MYLTLVTGLLRDHDLVDVIDGEVRMSALILGMIAAALLGRRPPTPVLHRLAELPAAHRLVLATLSFLRRLEAWPIAAGLDAAIRVTTT